MTLWNLCSLSMPQPNVQVLLLVEEPGEKPVISVGYLSEEVIEDCLTWVIFHPKIISYFGNMGIHLLTNESEFHDHNGVIKYWAPLPEGLIVETNYCSECSAELSEQEKDKNRHQGIKYENWVCTPCDNEYDPGL